MSGEPLVILLIEDNLDHAELVKDCFEDFRILNIIIHVKDGEEALNYLFHLKDYADINKFPKPNLILLDLRLPKVDGIEVLKRVKEDNNLKNIPVVVLTSSDNEKDLLSAYDNYVNSYLIKPLDFNKFTSLMKELGFYWLCWNKLSY